MSLLKSRFIEMFGDPNTNSLDLPEKPIKNICKNFDSKRVPITSSDRVDGKYPYYGASGIVDWVDNFIFDDDLLLVSEDGANLSARVTPIAFSIKGKTWVNNHAHVLKFDDLYMQNYAEFFFNQLDLTSKITGTAQPKFNQSALNETMIPIPSKESLVHFKNVCNQIDKSKFLLQQILEKLELLKKSRFIEIYEKEKSKEVSLSDVCDVRDGTHDSPKFVSEGYPLITSKNVTSGVINFDNVNFISKDDFDSINKRSKVDINDIIMPMIGTIGCPVIVDTDTQFAIKNVALIKTSKTEKLLPTYICAFLNSKYFHSQLRSLSRGCTQKFISLGNIRSIKLKALSDDSQKEICSFINQIDKSKLIIQKALDDLVGKV